MLWGVPRVDGDLYFNEGGMETTEEAAITQLDKMKRQRTIMLVENRSGIGWKFASQGSIIFYRSSRAPLMAVETGFDLLSLATGESSIISRKP
jgi:hypothetical protein